MQMIYVVYIVAFPLISNTQAGGPAADLEILMRDNRWFAPIYTVGILLLYYLFWQAMQLVQNISRLTAHASRFTFHASRLRIVVLAFGLLFAFTLVWLYPITANDLFRYVLRGRVWAVHGASPMLSPPNEFPDDPYIAFAGEFGNWASGYGPLWEMVVQVPLRLGATDMVPGAIGLKLVVLLSFLTCAILIGWFATPFQSPISNLQSPSSSLTVLTFFAWNPLILMQGLGNGHNDMVFMALMVLGIILWQRKLWWGAAAALTLAALAKATALLMIPLFGVLLLRSESTWRQRIFKGLGAALIGLVIAYLIYSVLGPISEVLQSVSAMLTTRRGFAIASGLRMVLREIIPRDVAETLPRATGRYIFLFFYAWLMLQLWRSKLNLVTAGFLAYFGQLMLGRTFRIWYPIWLVPLAALYLTPTTFWRTLLFGLTAELSIINYFVVWRWWLRDLPWGKLGPLSQYWSYWTIMHTLTVPWLFGIPLFGPIVMRWWKRKKPLEINAEVGCV
jgi:alpha-1,6-mannosyltransferase